MKSIRSGDAIKYDDFIKPMTAQIRDKPFDDEAWIFEIKWDGYRAVAETGNPTRLYSRNGLSFAKLYPVVIEELSKIKEKTILDGEIVAFNNQNKPDFQKLQQYGYYKNLSLVYYVFDCLAVKGKSITHLPLVERKKILKSLLPKSNIIRYADHVEEKGIAFFNEAVKMDLEGIIAKRSQSTYLPGKRSSDWLKIKHHNTQEAVIVGYTAPRGGRQYFGALILALMRKGKPTYIGHTGTGFTTKILKEVYEKLQSLKTDSSPFTHKIPVNSPVTWVKPVLVCNIKYSEVTQDGILRHPVFMGLRIDKTAAETTRLDAKKSAVKRVKSKRSEIR